MQQNVTKESAYKEKLLRLAQEIQSPVTLKRLYNLAKRLHITTKEEEA